VDLLKGDSTSMELKQANLKLDLLQMKVDFKDKMIAGYDKKIKLYDEQLQICAEKEINYNNIIIKLEADSKKLKKTVKILGASLGVSAVILTTAFLLR